MGGDEGGDGGGGNEGGGHGRGWEGGKWFCRLFVDEFLGAEGIKT